jgi:hypothetical protein
MRLVDPTAAACRVNGSPVVVRRHRSLSPSPSLLVGCVVSSFPPPPPFLLFVLLLMA